MNAIAHREVACAILLDTSGRFLLQQRDTVPGIVHPGKIGLFGGHREGGESYLRCVVREIYEEIGHFVPPGQLEYLSSYESEDPERAGGGTLHAEFFVARDLPVQNLVVAEGSLMIIEPAKLITIDSQLTPEARFAIRAFQERNRHP
jgi:8-oxo-dGTP pyrophosphatase MutT (NUDIX family)